MQDAVVGQGAWAGRRKGGAQVHLGQFARALGDARRVPGAHLHALRIGAKAERPVADRGPVMAVKREDRMLSPQGPPLGIYQGGLGPHASALARLPGGVQFVVIGKERAIRGPGERQGDLPGVISNHAAGDDLIGQRHGHVHRGRVHPAHGDAPVIRRRKTEIAVPHPCHHRLAVGIGGHGYCVHTGAGWVHRLRRAPYALGKAGRVTRNW